MAIYRMGRSKSLVASQWQGEVHCASKACVWLIFGLGAKPKDKASAQFMCTQSRDFVIVSACVARNLFGATKINSLLKGQ